MHVDKFIWETTGNDYARWMLMHFRLPAVQQLAWKKFLLDYQLFCTWQGKRYRVTGASRLGDVWLAKDFNKDTGYDHRVDLAECSEWGDSRRA